MKKISTNLQFIQSIPIKMKEKSNENEMPILKFNEIGENNSHARSTFFIVTNSDQSHGFKHKYSEL